MRSQKFFFFAVSVLTSFSALAQVPRALLKLNNGIKYTNQTSVPSEVYNLSGGAPKFMAIFSGSGCTGTETWIPFVAISKVDIPAIDGQHVVSLKLKAADNLISTCIQAAIAFDKMPPSGVSFTTTVTSPTKLSVIPLYTTANDLAAPMQSYLSEKSCTEGGVWSVYKPSSNYRFAAGLNGVKKTLYSAVKDALGNTSACLSLSVTIDNVLPTLTFVPTQILMNNVKNYDVSGTCGDNGVGNIDISVTPVTKPATTVPLIANIKTDCVGGKFSKILNLSDFPDGYVIFTVLTVDQVGNQTGLYGKGTVKDSTNAYVSTSITTPAQLDTALTTSQTVTLKGLCTNGFPIAVKLDNGPGIPLVCENGAFSSDFTLQPGDGQKRIILSQQGKYNTSTVYRTFTKNSPNSSLTNYKWKPLKIGAGGFLVGQDIHPDGSKVVRADVYGAYKWDKSRSNWRQLVTSSTMPADEVNYYQGTGVYEIRIAPSSSKILYMNYKGNIYKSIDGAYKWTRTSFVTVSVDANDGFRDQAQKITIDPFNPNIVYVGTPDKGMFVTFDGGATFSNVAGIPVSLSLSVDGANVFPGISGIAFDPKGGVLNGRTKIIMASSYGNGVFRSEDAGVTWKTYSDGPKSVSQGKFSASGAYYGIAENKTKVVRFQNGAWEDLTPKETPMCEWTAEGWQTFAIDPRNPQSLILADTVGYVTRSRDGGVSWDTRSCWPRMISDDVPWLMKTRIAPVMAAAAMDFDPSGVLWVAEGTGVWYSDIVPEKYAKKGGPLWTSQSVGIEELVANSVISPPGGNPLAISWDRPVFKIDNPDTYKTNYGPIDAQKYLIVHGWAADYAASNPRFVAGIFNSWGWNGIPTFETSGYSVDGGTSWRQFASKPPIIDKQKLGGSMAVSTPQNIIWSPSFDSPAYYTLNGGVTWVEIVLPGIVTNGKTSGYGNLPYYARTIVTADRVKAKTFYLFNYLGGLYRTVDGGVSWELMTSHKTFPSNRVNARFQTVPGKEGHLFYSSGQQYGATVTHPVNLPFLRSVDGGKTWTELPNIQEVGTYSFGKGFKQGDYPTIFIMGYVNGVFGYHRSTDDGVTWRKFGEYPMGSLDFVRTMSGDMNSFGVVYVGFAGSGYSYFGP